MPSTLIYSCHPPGPDWRSSSHLPSFALCREVQIRLAESLRAFCRKRTHRSCSFCMGLKKPLEELIENQFLVPLFFWWYVLTFFWTTGKEGLWGRPADLPSCHIGVIAADILDSILQETIYRFLLAATSPSMACAKETIVTTYCSSSSCTFFPNKTCQPHHVRCSFPRT